MAALKVSIKQTLAFDTVPPCSEGLTSDSAISDGNQNYIHKEIKATLNAENACCLSVRNMLSPRLTIWSTVALENLKAVQL
jgi:hypothetical protein